MTPETLLRELDTLSHDRRMRRMAEVGKQAARDPEAAATLAALEQGDFYQRLLSLQACYGSRDGERVLRALAGVSRALRRRGVRLLALCGSDEQVRRGLPLLSRDQRLALLSHLRRRGRLAPVDNYLHDLAGRDDRDLEVLLPYGSPAVVERYLDRAFDRGGVGFWKRLARFHPARALSAFRARVEPADQSDPLLLPLANVLLATLADTHPDELIAQLPALGERVPLGLLDLTALSRRRPAEVADLLLASRDEVPARITFNNVARRLDADRLAALMGRGLLSHGGAGGYGGRPFAWFRRLAPEQRGRLYRAYPRGWQDARGCAPAELLKLLPRAVREAEARRHLALPVLATRPAEAMPYMGLLPWQEAFAELGPWVKHPEGETRARALSALGLAVTFDRARAGEYLALVRARRNEQDPVRLAMLTALAGLPPGLWKAEHLGELGGVIRDALSAADLSEYSATHAERLVVALLPAHPEWAAGWLTTLARERGRLNFHLLQERLTDSDVARLGPVLLPVLKVWEKREREQQTLQLAANLGRRLRAFPALLDILQRTARTSRTQWVAEQCLALIAQHAPDRLKTLVPELVREDPSWITCATVSAYLHRRRQDLLTPFLGQRAYRGRFSTGRTRFVLPLLGGFFRWTAAQQSTFASTLREITDKSDTMRDVPAVATAIRQLAALPAAPPDGVLALANDPRPAVRDTALRALGRLDSGQGVGALIEALGNDRAGVAAYALRSAVCQMPEGHALDLLRRVPRERVTVAKEVVRLVGERPSPAAFAFLREVEARAPHRDVHVALLRALWDYLERPEAWEMLGRAAGAPDPALLSGVVRIPADRLSGQARGRLVRLLADLLHRPEPAVRVAVLQRCREAPVPDAEGALLRELLRLLASPLPDERAAAGSALFGCCAARDAGAVAGAVAGLLPDRRGLLDGVQGLRAVVRTHRARLVPVAREVLGVLARDLLASALRAELAVAALPWRELADLFVEMDGAGLWRADVLHAAVQALAGRHADGEGLEALEAALTGRPSAELRRLALAALAARSAPPEGWDPARLGRLRAFRSDPAPLVAAAAQFTLPAEETRG